MTKLLMRGTGAAHDVRYMLIGGTIVGESAWSKQPPKIGTNEANDTRPFRCENESCTAKPKSLASGFAKCSKCRLFFCFRCAPAEQNDADVLTICAGCATGANWSLLTPAPYIVRVIVFVVELAHDAYSWPVSVGERLGRDLVSQLNPGVAIVYSMRMKSKSECCAALQRIADFRADPRRYLPVSAQLIDRDCDVRVIIATHTRPHEKEVEEEEQQFVDNDVLVDFGNTESATKPMGYWCEQVLPLIFGGIAKQHQVNTLSSSSSSSSTTTTTTTTTNIISKNALICEEFPSLRVSALTWMTCSALGETTHEQLRARQLLQNFAFRFDVDLYTFDSLVNILDVTDATRKQILARFRPNVKMPLVLFHRDGSIDEFSPPQVKKTQTAFSVARAKKLLASFSKESKTQERVANNQINDDNDNDDSSNHNNNNNVSTTTASIQSTIEDHNVTKTLKKRTLLDNEERLQKKSKMSEEGAENRVNNDNNDDDNDNNHIDNNNTVDSMLQGFCVEQRTAVKTFLDAYPFLQLHRLRRRFVPDQTFYINVNNAAGLLKEVQDLPGKKLPSALLAKVIVTHYDNDTMPTATYVGQLLTLLKNLQTPGVYDDRQSQYAHASSKPYMRKIIDGDIDEPDWTKFQKSMTRENAYNLGLIV